MDTTQPVNSVTRITQLRRRALQASLGQLPRVRAPARRQQDAQGENLAASDPSSDSSLHADPVRPSPLLRLIARQHEGAGRRSGALAGAASSSLAAISTAEQASRFAPGSQTTTTTTTTATTTTTTTTTTAGTFLSRATTTTTTTPSAVTTSTLSNPGNSSATSATIASIATSSTATSTTGKSSHSKHSSELISRLFGTALNSRSHGFSPANLHDAVLARDWNSAARLARGAHNIFCPMAYGEPGVPAGHIRRKPSISILELALDYSQKECALGMALYCQTNRQERDARLLDMLRLAVREGRWERVAGLLFVIEHIGLKLRSRSYDELFSYLLRSDELHLACLTLRIGPARALTGGQLNKLMEAALKWGSPAVLRHLLAFDPELLRSRACNVQRVLEYASPDVVVALIEAGYQPETLRPGQIEPLLITLLECAQQHHACTLLQRYAQLTLDADAFDALISRYSTAELPAKYRAALRLNVGELLQVAINVQADHFLELLLARVPVHDPILQDSLYTAQKSAIWRGYVRGVQILARCGVDLYQNPHEGRALLRQLIEKGRKHSLAALVRNEILSLHSVFLRLILRGQLGVLCELQRLLSLSFCLALDGIFNRPQASAACTQTLRQLLSGMRLAAQEQQNRAGKILCVGLEAGLSPVSARNLAHLRDRLLQCAGALHGQGEQQHLLLMAACLEMLRPPAQIPWPAPLDRSQSAQFDDEVDALAKLGQGVIAGAGERLHAECLLELKVADASPVARFSRRLQAGIGLPAHLADLLERSVQALQRAYASQQGARADPAKVGLAQEILRNLQVQPKPGFDPDNLLTAWHCAAWRIVARLANRLMIDTSTQ